MMNTHISGSSHISQCTSQVQNFQPVASQYRPSFTASHFPIGQDASIQTSTLGVQKSTLEGTAIHEKPAVSQKVKTKTERIRSQLCEDEVHPQLIPSPSSSTKPLSMLPGEEDASTDLSSLSLYYCPSIHIHVKHICFHVVQMAVSVLFYVKQFHGKYKKIEVTSSCLY